MLKRILILLVVLFIAAQFVQPDRSSPATDPANDMLYVTNAPADIRQLVIGACYDCHSYRTEYPWYAYISPLSFLVQDHINEGREHLNFSLWDKYATDKHAGEAGKELQEGEMSPGYYRLMHGHGRLSDPDKQKVMAWFNSNLPKGEGGAPDAADDDEEVEE